MFEAALHRVDAAHGFRTSLGTAYKRLIAGQHCFLLHILAKAEKALFTLVHLCL